jgi:hypothetical protein
MRSPDQFCTGTVRWLVTGSIGSAQGLGNLTDTHSTSNSDGHKDTKPKRPLFISDYRLHGYFTGAALALPCPNFVIFEELHIVPHNAVSKVKLSPQQAVEAYRVEMLRIPHCLYNRFTDGGKVVSPTHRPSSTSQNHYFSASVIHFCQRLNKSQGLVRLEGLGKLKKIQWPHRVSNPRPLGWQNNALTTTLPRAPK